MASYVAIPKLGMAMVEATVVKWQVPEGSRVAPGDVVVTIETDKTTWDVEASAGGLLHVLVPEEETVPVGRVVGLLAANEGELASLQGRPPEVIMTTASEPTGEAGPVTAAAPAAEAPAAAPGRREEVRISPVAKKIAEEHGLDLATVRGTGPDGRIIRSDVEEAIAARAAAPATPPARAAAAVAPPTAPGIETVAGRRVAATIPLRGMRRSIAEHMRNSLAVSAQLTYISEAEMTELVALRTRLVAREAELGFRVTYTDLMVMAVARALRDVPILNASIVGDEIRVWEDVNIGVAVALDHGLEGGIIVPVIREVGRKTLRDVSSELAALVERARAGKLLPDDVADGTFTITNLATVGGGWFTGTPIINQPQVAILATGAVSDRPVARDGQVVIRPMMPFSLTFDHRVVDGAPAARFAVRLTELLAEPALLLV